MMMNNFIEIHYAIQLGLLFILVITGAWRKSFTTLVFIIATVIMFFKCQSCMDTNYSHYTINALSILSVFRTMLHSTKDKIIRRY